jgi:hypothetical protein
MRGPKTFPLPIPGGGWAGGGGGDGWVGGRGIFNQLLTTSWNISPSESHQARHADLKRI